MRFFTLRVLLILMVAFVPAAVRAQAVSHEFKLKAAYLFNFVQFVDWPANAFADPKSPLVIGILGHDPFGATIDEVIQGETVRGRKLQVQRFKTLREVQSCHVLFINSSESGKMASILAGLKGRSILTVSDVEGFTRSGGMIRFVTERNKIRFRINVAAARQAGLTISARLLQLAETVRDEPQQ